MRFLHSLIIPYQELLGNDDPMIPMPRACRIIPYQELLGNDDKFRIHSRNNPIIPYQELLGNDDQNIRLET